MNILRSVRWLLLGAAVAVTAASAPAQVFIGISVHIGPPVMPVYVQPPCPAPNLMWTPGHWRWDPDMGDYYWVPGAWVPVPYVGALWTPGYWGWVNGGYGWHEGYWGPHIGYYGGVNYGGGYMGIGFAGGTWNGGVFAYNTAVVNVNRVSVTNVYINQTIVNQTTIVNTNHVAYSGGPGGIQHQATPEEQIAEHDQHVQPTKFQEQHQESARQDKSNFSKNNGGHPTHLVSEKPLAAEAHAAPAGYHPPAARPMTELAKQQAPPSVQHAAQESSNKTVQAAKANPPAHANPPGTGGKQANEAGGSHPGNPAHATEQTHTTAPPAHAMEQTHTTAPPAHAGNPGQPHPNANPHPSNTNANSHTSNPPPHPNAQNGEGSHGGKPSAPQSHPSAQPHPNNGPKPKQPK